MRRRRPIAPVRRANSITPIADTCPNDCLSSDEESLTDTEEDLENLTSHEKNLTSPFNEPNIALVFGQSKLYVQKEHLIAVSPVFEAMFSPNFLEGSSKEISLPGKKLSHFVHFIRCLSPGFDDVFTEKTVRRMLPLAEEYQTDGLKKRIEQFLVKSVRSKSDLIRSERIIVKILEAERYKLNAYLFACISVASRKTFCSLTKNPKYNEISQDTQLKISYKRWVDIDEIYDKAVHVNPMYLAYFLKHDTYCGAPKEYEIDINDVGKKLKPYMQNN